MSELTSNRGVLGRAAYTVVCPLASGGMGRVDLVARREGPFFRLFAQKRLRLDLVDDPEVQRMFVDEARIAGLVDHPNVVSVVDVGDDQRGPFLVMDFVDGASLSELIQEAAARGERLPIDICLRIARQAAEGLHALHELRGTDGELLQLVHRDVSPQNILIGFDGIARVTDFGIAKARGRAAKTTAGVIKGKVGYLSPEQLRFEELDRRADLFALGVVLFEMLVGRRLYESGGDMDGPRRILHEPPPDLAEHRDDVEPELVELLFELLAKDRLHRPPDARTIGRRLDDILAGMVEAGAGVDTGAYVQQLFGHKREALRRRIADVAWQSPARADPRAAPAVPPTIVAASRARPTDGEGPPFTGVVAIGPRRKRLLAGGAIMILVAVLATFAPWRGRGPVRITIGASRAAAPPASAVDGAHRLSASLDTSPVPPMRAAFPISGLAPAAARAHPIAPPRVAASGAQSRVKRRPARQRPPRGQEDCRLPGSGAAQGNQRFDIDCLIRGRD